MARQMLNTPFRDNRNKIVILNPKGGCGKSTLVTNIAVCYAKRGDAEDLSQFLVTTLEPGDARPLGVEIHDGGCIAALRIADRDIGHQR